MPKSQNDFSTISESNNYTDSKQDTVMPQNIKKIQEAELGSCMIYLDIVV